MLWQTLPDELDTKAGPLLLDFVLHKTVPSKSEGTMVAFNLAGYAASQVGLSPTRAALPEPTPEECEQAARALCAPAGVQRGVLPWGVILKLAITLLQALACIVLLLLIVAPAQAQGRRAWVFDGIVQTAAVQKVRGANCQCGPDCPCANCPGNCAIEQQRETVQAAPLPPVSYQPFFVNGNYFPAQPASQRFIMPTRNAGSPVRCVGGS